MTVKVRPYKRGGWEIDIMLTFPGREPIRERRKAPMGSKSAARRWGEERERQLVQHYTSTDADDESRPDISKKEVPTLARFFPRYIEGYCKANRLRPATIWQRTNVADIHLIPALGNKRLDRITAEDIQRLKAERVHLKNRTVDIKLGTLTVSRAMWRGHEGLPKSGRHRSVPLAPRLRTALKEHRHLRGPNVLCTMRGTRPSTVTIRRWLNEAQAAAGFEESGPHVLRHTFCSHLAMAGVPPRVIQELAGHQSVSTTERYMHLAPTAVRDAILALHRPEDWRHAGDAPSGVVKLQPNQPVESR
jgi:integrase